jgi:hypothetical protein
MLDSRQPEGKCLPTCDLQAFGGSTPGHPTPVHEQSLPGDEVGCRAGEVDSSADQVVGRGQAAEGDSAENALQHFSFDGFSPAGGQDGSRGEGVDSDPIGCPFESQRLGEGRHPGFSPPVNRPAFHNTAAEG